MILRILGSKTWIRFLKNLENRTNQSLQFYKISFCIPIIIKYLWAGNTAEKIEIATAHFVRKGENDMEIAIIGVGKMGECFYTFFKTK